MKKTTRKMKNMTAVRMIAVATMLSALLLAGCAGNNTSSTATPDEAASTVTSTVEQTTTVPEATLNATDKAIVDSGLKVDAKGNITDSKGNKVEADKDGKVEVTKSDGTKVKVDATTVKQANENKTQVDNTNAQNANNSNNRVTPAPANNTNNNNKNTNTNTNTNTNNKPATPKATEAPKPVQPATQKPTEAPKPVQPATQKPTQADPHAGKTWHEAVYEYIDHPAVTEKVWVVDQEADSYEEPIYETRYGYYCKGCGMEVGNNVMTEDERSIHMSIHHHNGEPTGYYGEQRQIQVGTKTVEVPEKGHYEEKIVKEAYKEKKLVREAGWY